MSKPYTIIEKPQAGYGFGSAYEVHQGGAMVSRHPNKSEAANAVKRFRKEDRRHCGALGHQIDGKCPNCGQEQVSALL